MVARWVIAGVLEAVKGFGRLKGHKATQQLVPALRARDQHLGLVADVGNVGSLSTEPPLNFNSEWDIADFRRSERGGISRQRILKSMAPGEFDKFALNVLPSELTDSEDAHGPLHPLFYESRHKRFE